MEDDEDEGSSGSESFGDVDIGDDDEDEEIDVELRAKLEAALKASGIGAIEGGRWPNPGVGHDAVAALNARELLNNGQRKDKDRRLAVRSTEEGVEEERPRDGLWWTDDL